MKKKEIFTDIKTLEDLKKLNLSFEDAFTKLQEIVDIQDENLSLEESIVNYKLGKILVLYCKDLLEKANLEVKNLEE